MNEDEEIHENMGEEVKELREVLNSLNTLQSKYAHQKFDDIPEDDQYTIKILQKDLNRLQPRCTNVEGNANKQYRTFTLQKLSGFMNTQELSRKFLQTGEKQGKYILKPQKHKKVTNDGKQKKKNLMQKDINKEMHDHAIEV